MYPSSNATDVSEPSSNATDVSAPSPQVYPRAPCPAIFDERELTNPDIDRVHATSPHFDRRDATEPDTCLRPAPTPNDHHIDFPCDTTTDTDQRVDDHQPDVYSAKNHPFLSRTSKGCNMGYCKFESKPELASFNGTFFLDSKSDYFTLTIYFHGTITLFITKHTLRRPPVYERVDTDD